MTTTPTADAGQTAGLSSRVATRVRMLMAARRKTVRELASEVLFLSERQAQRLHKGEQAYSLAQLEDIAAWLDVDPVVFLTGAGLEQVAA